jgi:hypothetical protein
MKMIRVATFAGPGTSPVIHEVAHPVTIRRQKRDVAVVLLVAEYEKLTQLNVEEFERFCDHVGARAVARGLTEEKLADLLSDG